MSRLKPWQHYLLLLGPSILLSILLLFHPWPYNDYIGKLVPIALWWTILHTLQFLLFPCVAASLWLLTEGLTGVPVILCRVSALIFVVFYGLADAIAGVSTGILAGAISTVLPTQQSPLIPSIGFLFDAPFTHSAFRIGAGAWVIALGALGVGLFRAGAPLLPLLLLLVPAGLLYGFDHAFPYGSFCFGTLFLIMVWLQLSSFGSIKRQNTKAIAS